VIPVLATVRRRRRDGRWLRLYIPVLPVLLLLSPLLLAGGLIACLVYRVSPWGALGGVGRVLWALPGARLHIDDGRTAVHINLS
jgi:hypothetical protein